MKTKEVKLSNDKLSLSRLYDRFGVLVVFVLLFAVSCMLSDRFLQTSNLFNILRQISMFGILSVGMTFVIVSGGIDLSVGSIIALVCVITANMVNDHGIIPAILVALLVGALVGLINGVGIAYGKLQPFIMTLGTMYMASGAASIYTNGTPISIKGNFSKIGNSMLFNTIPLPAIYFIVILIAAYLVMRNTRFGRHVYSIGSNKEATRLAGVDVKKVTLSVYILSGVLAAVTGIIFAAQMASGSPVAGEGYEMNAITAAVVGGTSMSGGKGNLLGTFLGAVIMGILSNIMNLCGVSSYWQTVLTGLILVVAILVRKD
ncbi:ABC transporter permease [uncultured Gemmiger sp.]|jgi:ribose/xylose/arabinose/galactoside ABC-type transport system permease subunit|uniref:ABC transporter permease n=1 Tax=uncultured Gemmiger sp. TaxID=1623490 RepID=UPI00266555A9|nr:ABC transporter permease [uncultured Gemmiger sp.]